MGPVFTWLERFGKGKEGWIFLTLLLYPAGYVATSYFYWRLGLGSVPLLDKQYFVAGLAPLAAIIVGKVLSDLADWSAKRSSDWTEVSFSEVAIVIWVLVGASAVLYGNANLLLIPLAAIYYAIPSSLFALFGLLWWCGLLFAFGTRVFESDRAAAIRGVVGIAGLLLTPVVTVLIPLVLLLRFMDDVYPQLPSTFGGAKPECAYVDLTREQVSDEMWTDLVADPTTLPAGVKVKRSVLLSVFYSSKDAMVVKLTDTSVGQGLRYELRGSAAQSITWVDCPS